MKSDKNCKGTFFYRQIEAILRRVVHEELAKQTTPSAEPTNAATKEDLQDAISQALIWAEARAEERRKAELPKDEPQKPKLSAFSKVIMVIFGLMSAFFLGGAILLLLNTEIALAERFGQFCKLLLVVASFLVMMFTTYAVDKHKDCTFTFHVQTFLLALLTVVLTLITWG